MNSKTKMKLRLNRTTLSTIAGGPGHRTTNRCTGNMWQSCETVCSCESCIHTCQYAPSVCICSDPECSPSDRRLKVEIDLIPDALALLAQLAL